MSRAHREFFIFLYTVPLTQHGLFLIKQEFYSLPASFL